MDVVSQLTEREWMSLEYTPVGDAGFAKLAGLASITELHLDQADITDASVKVLSGFTKLRYVDLYHTEVSETGYESLKKALTGCTVNWSRDAARRERRT